MMTTTTSISTNDYYSKKVMVVEANNSNPSSTSNNSKSMTKESLSTVSSQQQPRIPNNGIAPAVSSKEENKHHHQTTTTTTAASAEPTTTSINNNNNRNRKKKKVIVQVLLFVHGLGILVGFYVFSSLYHTQCSQLLIEERQKTKAVTDGDDGNNNNQYQHQELLQSHQDVLLRFSKLQISYEESQREIVEYKAQIQNWELKFDNIRQEHDNTMEEQQQKQQRLSNQLELSRSMLQEKVAEVEEYKQQYIDDEKNGDSTTKDSYYNNWSPEGEEEGIMIAQLSELHNSIRQRHMVESVRQYGPAPYNIVFLVQLAVDNQKMTTHTLEFTLTHLHQHPHTTYTFLQLVDNALYQDTVLEQQQRIGGEGAAAADVVYIGGHPRSIRGKKKSLLSKKMRQYAELGFFGVEPLLFQEEDMSPSSGDCHLAMSKKGPDLILSLDESGQSGDYLDDDSTCLGQLIEVPPLLADMMITMKTDSSSPSMPSQLTIIDARVIRSSNGSSSSSKRQRQPPNSSDAITGKENDEL